MAHVCSHFLEIECDSKECKVHHDFVFAKMSEAFVITVAETVDCDKIGTGITRKPDEMDVADKTLLYLAAGIDVVQVGIQNRLQHHAGMVRTATFFFIQLVETR